LVRIGYFSRDAPLRLEECFAADFAVPRDFLSDFPFGIIFFIIESPAQSPMDAVSGAELRVNRIREPSPRALLQLVGIPPPKRAFGMTTSS